MNAIEVHIDRATIQAITRLIVERFDPEQIILFGSHARGEANEHSDLDSAGRDACRCRTTPARQSYSSSNCQAFRVARRCNYSLS